MNAATQEGLRAYETERVRGLQEAESARSQERLDMAKQLQPGMMRAQDLANKEKDLTLRATAEKLDRDKLAREKMTGLLEDLKGGKITDPKEFHERFGDAVVAGGDPKHIQDWLTHHEALMKEDKLGQGYRATAGLYMKAMKDAADKPTDPKVWGDAVSAMLAGDPVAASGSPFFKSAFEHMNTAAANQLPRPVSEAYQKYFELRVAGKGAAQAWSEAGAALGRTDAALLGRFNALQPQDVKNDIKLQFEGKKAATVEAAKQPFEIQKIEKRGEESRKTLDVRLGAVRDRYQKTNDMKTLNADLGAAQKKMSDARATMNNQNADARDRERARLDHDAAQDEITVIQSRMHELSSGSAGPQPVPAPPPTPGGPTPLPAPGPGNPQPVGAERRPGAQAPSRPGQVRQQKITEVRPKLEQALRTPPQGMTREQWLGRIVDHNVQKGEITQAEGDYLKKLYAKP